MNDLLKEFDEYKWSLQYVIEAYLEFSNMSRNELGRKLGVSGTTVGRWVKGKTCPSLAMWSHIKEILNIEEEDADPRLMIPKEADFLPVEQLSENDYLAAWLCPNCGEKVEWDGEEEETFCKNCGQRITWIDKETI